MPSRTDLANAIRVLSMDAVQQANSGHPGAPMGMADIAEVLWNGFLKHNPSNPNWVNRDRFVLSNGHGSMLLYSLLHLTGYDVSIDDLKAFRQLHSKTPGHPELQDTPGVETTTGPLGQGLSNAVGMALAERTLAAQFNQDGFPIVDHYTYAFVGDGCLMEGISHEVCSLAGTLKLGKLVVLYDDNGISIDGDVDAWFSDDTKKRFESYGWEVLANVDGHNPSEIEAAITKARQSDRPSLVCCRTLIGKGAPNKEGGHDVHGAPLGADEIAATRKALNWNAPAFDVPEDIRDGWLTQQQGAQHEQQWQELFDAYQAKHPELAKELTRRQAGELPSDFAQTAQRYIQQCQADGASVASRKASQNCLNAYGNMLPELLGGSADLSPSNNTIWSGSVPINSGDDSDRQSGNYVHYGVREFGMSAIMNGMALHGGFIPYGATFLVFMEYARNAIRMAALMQQRCIFVYTHDSIGLGEDGPTHQPIEQLTNLRTTPNLNTWRPCDTVESAVAWKSAIESQTTPSALIFSRQGLPHQARSDAQLLNVEKGGYVLKAASATPQLILMATGSEVDLAIQAAEVLEEKGTPVQVVSMPCTEVFDAQSADYKETVLPSQVTKRIAIEAGHVDFWYKYVGLNGDVIGMRSFGASAPIKDLYAHFGITVDAIVSSANAL
ncbi:MAG: transketolase [Pseudomonadota bacterium]